MKYIPKHPIALTEEQRVFIERLLTKNEAVIKYSIRKTLGDMYRHLLEECVSELYLLACEKAVVLETHSAPTAWVIVAARLIAFTAIKRNNKYGNNVPLERAKIIGTDTTFEEALYGIWTQNNISEKLIDLLTKRENEVYRKLYVENKSVETTAKELGLTPSTVRTYKKTIKDKILEHIEKKI